MSKHSVTIRRLRVVTTCWSWAWSNRPPPSLQVSRVGWPARSMLGVRRSHCYVHTVHNLCLFNCQCHFYLYNWGPYVRLAFVSNMLSSWNKDIIIGLGISILLNSALLFLTLFFTIRICLTCEKIRSYSSHVWKIGQKCHSGFLTIMPLLWQIRT